MSTPIPDQFQKWVNQILKSTTATISLGVLLLGLVFASTCFKEVTPYEFGVKQVNIPWFIGMSRGIQPEVYPPGRHFVMPFNLERLHLFPRDIQVLDLTNSANRVPGNFYKSAAFIQTSDGFFVEVDVSIMFRIIDPVSLIKSIGPGNLYLINGLFPKAEPVLKDTLGKLTTEEFYNPFLRVEKMHLAKTKLNEALNNKGLQIDELMIRYFKYSDEIQKNIEAKKLQDQLVFKNQQEAKAATAEAELAKIIEEGEALMKIELEKGSAQVMTTTAEKDLYVRQKHAQADLLVKQAEANKIKLKNRALQGAGSENLVGLEMAKILTGVEMIVLPSDGASGFNPLNLEKTKGLFQ
ncbi:MAG: hypothetical protein CL521_06275 [Actinobacteria bacterium]|nr:hypothetical protein [Actinomycetota bacterium]